MTQLSQTSDGGVFAVSSVHVDTPEAPVLVISRPVEAPPKDGLAADRETNAHSSIHFRQDLPSVRYKFAGPRLTLTCLDTALPSSTFDFGSPIGDVGLHDDSSNLIVHVFLHSHVLYSMILTPDQLRNPRTRKEDGWISEYSAPSFQIRSPLCMHSVSATNIVFSLQDGGLMRLANNGAGYNEHVFSDSSYFSSFKSILPWSSRPSNLVISMKSSASKNLLFTMSVDGKVKIWDIRKGQLLFIQDAFVAERPLTFLLDPVPSNSIAFQETSNGFLLATYCSQLPGVFKIFKGRANGIEEVFSCKEEQPTTGLWRVFDLQISHVRNDNVINLIVLWKLDTLSLVQTAHINLTTSELHWKFAAQCLGNSEIPTMNASAIVNFIFTPERFSKHTLSQAIKSMPLDTHNLLTDKSLSNLKTVASRLIDASVVLETDVETGNQLHEKRDEDLRLRYLNLAQICVELDRLAGEPHALVQSPFTHRAYISQSSKLSIIRSATELETRLQATQSSLQRTDPISLVLHQCSVISQGLSHDSWTLVGQVLRDDCIQERTLSADDAMFLTYEKTIENQLPRATVNSLQQGKARSEDLLNGLTTLLSLFAVSMRGSIVSDIGAEAYVAEHRTIIEIYITLLPRVIAFLMYTACSSEELNLYQASSLFIQFMQAYRHLSLLQDSFTIPLMTNEESNDYDIDISRVTVADDAAQSTSSDGILFRHMAIKFDGSIGNRDFLERALVLLINANQAGIAVHFSQYVAYSPVATYLKARSLLSDQQYDAAAVAFARIARPILASSVTKAERLLVTKLPRGDAVDYYLHVAALFASAGRHTESLRFCNEALLSCQNGTDSRLHEVSQRIFGAAIEASNWSEAYYHLRNPSLAVQKDNIRSFVTAICDSSSAKLLLTYPFLDIREEVDSALERKARSMLDVRSRPSYHKILYAMRTSQSDFRGAASILYHKLQFLSNRSHVDGFNVADHLEITESYLAVINALRCLPADDRWIIVGTIDYAPTTKRTRVTDADDGGSAAEVYRKVLTLEDVKREYNGVLHGLQAQLNQLAGLVNEA